MNAAVVAAVLGQVVVQAPPPPVPFIATAGATTPQEVFDFVRNHLSALYGTLRLLGLDIPALTKIMVAEETMNWPKPACNTLERDAADPAQPKAIKFGYKLNRIDVRAAFARFAEFVDGQSWRDPPANAAQSARQFAQFLELKATFIRLFAAAGAAKDARVTLAEALALYRVEGDLGVPLPKSHLDQALPSMDRGYAFSYDPNQVFELTRAMQNGLWGWRKAFIDASENLTLMAPAEYKKWMQLNCYLDWTAFIWGSDYIFGVHEFGSLRLTRIDPYVSFSARVRGITGAANLAQHKTDVQALIDTLEYGENGEFVYVVSTDPARLLRFILAEGLMFMKLAGTHTVNGPFIKPHEKLAYLAHNSSDTRDDADPTQDRFSWILASAAVRG